jgi:metal-responsive CopG/Arc/MetJ family transcriptional regulator
VQTISCRFPDPLIDRLDAAGGEECEFQSEIIREALVFYMAENPDSIRAFREVAHKSRRRSSPVEQAEVDVEEADLEADAAGGVVPYDPTEEL